MSGVALNATSGAANREGQRKERSRKFGGSKYSEEWCGEAADAPVADGGEGPGRR